MFDKTVTVFNKYVNQKTKSIGIPLLYLDANS